MSAPAPAPRERLLARVIAYAATDGVADKSLREIAAGVGTSHRMLLYHFGSREGLLVAIVAEVERQQRVFLATLVEQTGAADGADVMRRQWEQLTDPGVRPYVRLFFAAVGLAVQGTPGTQALLTTLTDPWLDQGAGVAARLGQPFDPAALRLGVAATRGLLLDLVAGADIDEVNQAYNLFVRMWQNFTAGSAS
jgi:AcrR family transcriptional regulator